MTLTGNEPSASNDDSHRQREELPAKLALLGIDPSIISRVVSKASTEELDLLEKLAGHGKPSAGTPESESTSLVEFRETVEQLGDEYVGTLTSAGLSNLADVGRDQLREGAEVLAELARMMRAVPLARRDAMWSAIQGEIKFALPYFQHVKRAITETGIAAALDAEDHAIMTRLRLEAMPTLDRAVLRIAGESDPERAMRGLVRAAHAAPRNVLANASVGQVLEESEALLQHPSPPAGSAPKPKRWTGFGKIFTGTAVAGVDIAGGIALSVVGGPLGAGVTLGGALASCAGGIGAICEGVGALRGE